MSELSPIEMKKEMIENENDIKNGSKKTDWKNFGKSILTNLIYTILIGFIGSNFIYILYSNLDTWFPSEPNKLPYAFPNKGMHEKISGIFSRLKSFKGGSSELGINDCEKIKDNIKQNSIKFSKLFDKLGFGEVGFPYTFINKEPGIISMFKNLLGESARYSYTTDRYILKRGLLFINTFENIGENLLFIFSLPLLMFLLVFLVPGILGYITTFISFILTYFESMTNNYGLLLTIIISFFTLFITLGIGMFWSGIIGITQYIQLLIKLLIMPLFDFDNVRNIFFCKSHILSILFVIMTISSAFTHLEDVPAVIMMITLIILTYGGLKKTKKI